MVPAYKEGAIASIHFRFHKCIVGGFSIFGSSSRNRVFWDSRSTEAGNTKKNLWRKTAAISDLSFCIGFHCCNWLEILHFRQSFRELCKECPNLEVALLALLRRLYSRMFYSYFDLTARTHISSWLLLFIYSFFSRTFLFFSSLNLMPCSSSPLDLQKAGRWLFQTLTFYQVLSISRLVLFLNSNCSNFRRLFEHSGYLFPTLMNLISLSIGLFLLIAFYSRIVPLKMRPAAGVPTAYKRGIFYRM